MNDIKKIADDICAIKKTINAIVIAQVVASFALLILALNQ